MTDPDSPATVSDSMAAMGLSPERIAHWLSLEEGAVRVDDEQVTDPDTPAPWPSRITLRG